MVCIGQKKSRPFHCKECFDESAVVLGAIEVWYALNAQSLHIPRAHGLAATTRSILPLIYYFRQYFAAVSAIKHSLLVDYSAANREHRNAQGERVDQEQDDILAELERELQVELEGFEDFLLSPSAEFNSADLSGFEAEMDLHL